MPNSPQSKMTQLAELLAANRLNGSRLDAVPADLRPGDLAEAYTAQGLMHETLTANGLGKRVGWKIGCTTPVMQKFLAIDSPCAGAIFDRVEDKVTVVTPVWHRPDVPAHAAYSQACERLSDVVHDFERPLTDDIRSGR